MKEQIIIQVLGLCWDDLLHLWSVAGHEFTGEELAENINKLMKRGGGRNISAKRPVGM